MTVEPSSPATDLDRTAIFIMPGMYRFLITAYPQLVRSSSFGTAGKTDTARPKHVPAFVLVRQIPQRTEPPVLLFQVVPRLFRVDLQSLDEVLWCGSQPGEALVGPVPPAQRTAFAAKRYMSPR